MHCIHGQTRPLSVQVFRVFHNSQEYFIFVRSVRKLSICHLECMMVDGGRKEEFSRDRVTLKSTNKRGCVGHVDSHSL